jgi:hypothetical protein
MSYSDRYPLADAPMTNRIRRSANNRLGAVYSALYSFWTSRHVAVTANRQAVLARRDAYSFVLFNGSTTQVLNNDFTSTPDQLLDTVLPHQASGSTNFTEALRTGQTMMEQNWTTERFAVFSPAILQVLCFDSSASQSTSHDLPVRRRMLSTRRFHTRPLSHGSSAWVLHLLPTKASC